MFIQFTCYKNDTKNHESLKGHTNEQLLEKSSLQRILYDVLSYLQYYKNNYDMTEQFYM